MTILVRFLFVGLLELVDRPDLGSGAIRHMGSSPMSDTRVTSGPLSW